MANDEHPAWSAGEPYAAVGGSAMPEDDFANFLDLDNIDFNFAGLDASAYSAATPENGDAQKFSSYDHSDNDPRRIHPAGLGVGDMPMVTDGSSHQGYPAYTHNHNGQYQWQANGQYHSHHSVPPTPNSSEMYPTPYHQQTGAGPQYHRERQSYNHKDDSFTPLTSPQFVGSGGTTAIHDYAVRDSQLLSPLTSPAIYAQVTSGGGPSSVQSLTAESSMTASPIDLDHDMAGDSALEERPRKTRKKDQNPKVTSTPSTATRKRKGSVASAKGSIRNGTLAKGMASKAREAPVRHSNPPSVSPQPQLDYSMRPPPLPSSAKSTPSITPLSATGLGSGGLPPATPASLMRLAKQQSSSGDDRSPSQMHSTSPSTEALGLGMEELTLPEAAAPPTDMSSRIGTPRASLQRSTSTRATPAILPRLASTGPSAMTSPKVLPFGNTSKNPAGRGGSRKRNSTSSTLVSPALRPRISPNIKPLIADHGKSLSNIASDDTHALLLASKSNYQNLLEGNHLPGVNYPSELSTNLTSKRTSHKIAEQGRRNRINTALQEMQTLLPPSPAMAGANASGDDSGSRSGSGGEPAGSKTPKTPATPAMQASANSKAATVELAIEYIKTLSGRIKDKEGENERLRTEMEALKKKLAEACTEA